ncbi:Uncharacterized protein APZ42_015970 [Daphnia magna]|uniref:Uncharacterized protein n=1 Tax=Daphnia magna TaxID=35525 RepID=A0A162NH40_9CRUS|nr:Uncharacterized protein APZ42_015970 [Daphnia magna]
MNVDELTVADLSPGRTICCTHIATSTYLLSWSDTKTSGNWDRKKQKTWPTLKQNDLFFSYLMTLELFFIIKNSMS